MFVKDMVRCIFLVKELILDSKYISILGNFEDLYLICFLRIGIL